MTRSEQIAQNLKMVKDDIARTCQTCGRSTNEVTLLAVSKFMDVTDILAVVNAGHLDFGENYAQEMVGKAKSPELKNMSVRWHFQGGLQSRKVKDILPIVATIQSIDRNSLVDELEKRADPAHAVPVFLEVNTGDEAQKSGAAAADALALCKRLLDIPGIMLQGLMCIPPFGRDPEESRPHFKMLRELRDELRSISGTPPDVLKDLSMGMTADYRIAIEEGATFVRVGTAIFGTRK